MTPENEQLLLEWAKQYVLGFQHTDPVGPAVGTPIAAATALANGLYTELNPSGTTPPFPPDTTPPA